MAGGSEEVGGTQRGRVDNGRREGTMRERVSSEGKGEG